MRLTPPATATGLAASVGRPSWLVSAVALAIGVGLTVCFYRAQALSPLVAAIVAATLVSLLARRHIGGYSGDVLGATEQVVQIAILLSIVPLP
jgi:adenosylcobinamide-GDP ribazoletransferase